jgi:nickel transport protein
MALGHGSGYRQSKIGAVALEFYYSTGEAMAYQEARVYSPGGERTAYQSGRTDEFGRYSFVPAAEGEWRVEVRDDEGHRAEAVIPITAEFVRGEREGSSVLTESSLPQGADLFVRALLGISLIFNIAAFVRLRRSGARGRRR